jgi:hypothetical protein
MQTLEEIRADRTIGDFLPIPGFLFMPQLLSTHNLKWVVNLEGIWTMIRLEPYIVNNTREWIVGQY